MPFLTGTCMTRHRDSRMVCDGLEVSPAQQQQQCQRNSVSRRIISASIVASRFNDGQLARRRVRLIHEPVSILSTSYRSVVRCYFTTGLLVYLRNCQLLLPFVRVLMLLCRYNKSDKYSVASKRTTVKLLRLTK